MTSNRHKVYKGLTSQTIITIIMGALELAYFSIMSRLLSQDDFGYFAVIMAVTAILNSLSESGFGTAVIQKKNASDDYVATAFTLSFLFGLLLTAFLFFGAKLFSVLFVDDETLTRGFQLISLTIFLTSLNSIGRAMFIRRLEFMKFGVSQILSFVISSFVGISLAWLGKGVYAIITAIIVNQAILTFLLYFYSHFTPKFSICRQYMKEILSFGGWMTGGVIVRNITSQMDSLLLSHFLSVSLLGSFNRPSGFITRVTDQINGIFDTILFPILSGIQDDFKKIQSAYRKSVVLVCLFSFVLAYTLILSSSYIIDIFFGEKWKSVEPVLQIISFTVIFLGYNRIADCFFRSIGIVKEYFEIRVLSCVTTSIFIILGCQFGLIGVALSLLMSRLFDGVVKYYVLGNYMKVNMIDFAMTCIRSTFFVSICFALLFSLKLIFPLFDYISVILFGVVICITAYHQPKFLGIEFKEVFCNILNRKRKNYELNTKIIKDSE